MARAKKKVKKTVVKNAKGTGAFPEFVEAKYSRSSHMSADREKLAEQFTAGGVVLALLLMIIGVVISPSLPMVGALMATLSFLSFMGAFMAKETL
ncbi:MAG: hypothetical protein NT157_03595 [Candidatus Micrarchaeota archaeon]|nr:hypothetical protein [Candidatus Micrarchaeota archaeon]